MKSVALICFILCDIFMYVIICFSGQELKDVMRHIEDLILYENFEKSETDTHKLV